MQKKEDIYPGWVAIASQSMNGVIGNGKYMPWDIPNDLKWFRTKTDSGNVLMGRKTFETIEVINKQCNYWILTKNPKLISDTPNVIYSNSMIE